MNVNNPPSADAPVEVTSKKGKVLVDTLSEAESFQRDGLAWTASSAHYGVRIEGDGRWSFQTMHAPRSKVQLPGSPLTLSGAVIERGSTRSAGGRARAGDHAAQVAIDRGVAVERITRGVRGVEQNWTFAQKPVDDGAQTATGGGLVPADLVVSVPVSGLDLFDQGSGGVRFRDPVTTAMVRYGVATWVDAAGTRTTLFPHYVDGAIVMVVPANVVEASTYPAVLDPTLSPDVEVDSNTAAANANADAVAFDSVHQQYLVVWENFGIFVRRLTYAGGSNTPVPVGSVLQLQTDPIDGDPNATGAGAIFDGTNYQVVWSGNGNDVNGVFAQRINSNGGLVDGAPLTVSTPANSVAVAGNSLGTVLVVYESGGSVFYRQLVNGAPSGAAVNIGSGNNPQIASDGSGFLVAWGHGVVDPFGQASAVTITSGLVVGGAISLSTTGGYPTVSFGSGKFQVVWSDSRLNTNSDQCYGKFITAGVASAEFAVATPGTGHNCAQPRSAFDGGKFTTTYLLDQAATMVEITPGNVPPTITSPLTLDGNATPPIAVGADTAGHAVWAAGTFEDMGNLRAWAGGISDDGTDGTTCNVDADCLHGHCIANYPANTGKTCCSGPCTSDNCNIGQCSSGTCTQTAVSAGTCGGFTTCQAAAAMCGLPADTDHDNIPNAWETNNNGMGHHYIDANCDGTWEANEATFDGSNVNVPDVYVTYDYMGYGLDDWSCNMPTDCSKLGNYHAGEACTNNKCVFNCMADTDCTTGAGNVCNSNNDCAAGQFCINDTCQRGPWHAAEKCLVNGSVTVANPNGTACGGVGCVCYHTHDPEAIAPGALQKVVDAFARHNVTLHITPGFRQPHSHVVSYRSDAQMDTSCEGASQGGGTVGLGKYAVGMYDLKPTHFQTSASEIMHYALFSHYVGCDTSQHCTPVAQGGTGDCPFATNPDMTPKNTPAQGQSGLAEISGNDFVVSLGGLVNDSAFSPAILDNNPNGGYSLVGATFMHELGHNLGLRHDGHVDKLCTSGADCSGGDTCTDLGDGEGMVCHEITAGMTGVEQPNYKPNYISLMNYRYEANGIANSNVMNVAAAGAAPTLGSTTPDATMLRLDFSTQSLPTGGPTPGALVENNLSDTAGLGAAVDGNFPNEQLLFTYKDGLCDSPWKTAPASGSVDWETFNVTFNATGQQADVDAIVGVNVCDGNPVDTLTGRTDWSNLLYTFQCNSTFGDGVAPTADYPQEPDVPSLSGSPRGTTCNGSPTGCLGPTPPPSGNPSCTGGQGCGNLVTAKVDIRPQAQNNWIVANDGYLTAGPLPINYTGGGCSVCGGTYGCFSNNTSTFTDPTPAGAVATGVAIQLMGTDCTNGGTLWLYVNGIYVGSTSQPENCNCGSCQTYPWVTYFSSTTAMPGYVQGGSNHLQIVSSNGQQTCLHDAIFWTYYYRSVGAVVYGSPLLEVSKVNSSSVTLGNASPVLTANSSVDLDGDGYKDLQLTYLGASTGLSSSATSATVNGTINLSTGGTAAFTGSDVVQMVNSPPANVSCSSAGYSGDNGCWYKGALGQTCNSVCGNRGGFNSAKSTHTGNALGKGFYPLKTSGTNWMSVECSSTDNNTDWGATGAAADGTFSHPACYLSCSCNN